MRRLLLLTALLSAIAVNAHEETGLEAGAIVAANLRARQMSDEAESATDVSSVQPTPNTEEDTQTGETRTIAVPTIEKTVAVESASKAAIPLLLDATLDELVSGLQAGLFTSVDLVNAYIARIQEVNGTLHVVTEINPDALKIAANLDAQRANGTSRGPLHGIPILLKNNIATDDAMNTTAGSWALVGAKVSQDSTVAAKLRKAGAVLLGKSNLSQWESYRSLNTTPGWSAYGGQAKGAYIEDQDPNGSSSGSAVGSSLGLALASIGSETMGSIVLPAGVANVVGIKPTVGLTSRHLVIPISQHQDTIGPIARTVKDAAYLLQAIRGVDKMDNYTSVIPTALREANFTAACDENALRGVTIGIPYNVLDLYGPALDPAELAAFEDAVKEVAAAGAKIVAANFTAFEQWQVDENSTLVLSADFLTGLPKYLSHLTVNPNNITDLASLRSWTRSHGGLEHYPERDTVAWDFTLGQDWDNTDPKFWEAYAINIFYGGEGGILSALKRNTASAVLLPTSIAPQIPALVGSPIITVPMGAHPDGTEIWSGSSFGDLVTTGPNVPYGVSFLGGMWSDLELIGYAYAYEQRTNWRTKVVPYIQPRTELKDVLESEAGTLTNGTATGTNDAGSEETGNAGGFIGKSEQAARFGVSSSVAGLAVAALMLAL